MPKNKPKIKSAINEEDAALFRRQIKGTIPIKSDRIVHKNRPKAPTEKVTANNSENSPANGLADLADFNADSSVDANDTLYFAHSGLQHRSIKKLKRGEYPIEARLDLHGQTATMAKQKLAEFLDQCQRSALKCVIVVHGRGIRSQNGIPVLKQAVNQWLRELPQVMAFSSATPKDGGVGAVYVILKRY